MSDNENTQLFKRWVGVGGTMIGAFMAVVDIQMTNSSLRDITGGLGATEDEGTWISTSYLIGEIVTIPLTAWMSQVFTVRWYLMANVLAFLTFSMLCGVATDLDEMIFFRAGQGFTGGVLIPMSFTVILTNLPKNQQPIGLGLFGIAATFGPAIGPVIGGWLTDTYSWNWDFYVNLFPGALMLAAIWYAIEPQPFRWEKLQGGDWWGMICMAIGLGSLIAMLEEGQRKDWFGSTFIRDAGLLAVIFIPLFIVIELVVEKPFVNLRLLRERNLGTACFVNMLLGFALYGSVYLLPSYLLSVQKYSAFQSGESMVSVGLPQLLIFPAIPLLMKKVDLRMLVSVGMAVFSLSCFLNTSMSLDFSGDQFLFTNVIRALGQPFTIIPLSGLATAALTPKDAGDGSALFNLMRNLGGSMGTALLDTLITRREQFHDLRIGETVTTYNELVRARLSLLQSYLIGQGHDPASASRQALGLLQTDIQQQSYVLAYQDCFYVLGWILLGGSFVVWIARNLQPSGGAAA